MKNKHPFRQATVVLLVTVFSVVSVLLPAAKAALVPTDRVLSTAEGEETRDRLQAMLSRADVQAQLEAWGVDHREAQARVASLSDQELQTFSAHMEELPAGGSTLGTIAVVSLIAFLVLLVTDIMGYTDIFPFTR